MEVELKKKYPLAVSADRAWAVLADIRAVAGCMPGAQITEQIGDTHYKGLVKSKVGPAVMSFTGDIEVLRFDADVRELELLGKGADKGGSSAAMKLFARLEPGDGGVDTCVLLGDATVTVSGKLAQFGGRLLVPIADAMLAQFAKNFETAAAAAEATAMPTSTSAPAIPSETPVLPAAALAPAPAPDAAHAVALETLAPTTIAATPISAPPATTPKPAVVLPHPRAAVSAAPANELNALTLMWTVVRGWFGGLFGKKTA